jgi:nitrite reductase (NADH) large subunit
MDTRIYSVGDIKGEGVETRENYEYTDEQNYMYRKIFVKDSIPIGAILIGDTSNAMKIINAIKTGTPVHEDIYSI